MTKTEHLLVCLAEECNEVAKRATKALRFGLSEVQSGQSLTNAQRINEEFNDLLAILEMLEEADLSLDSIGKRQAVEAKKQKVARFLNYSAECGTLSAPTD